MDVPAGIIPAIRRMKDFEKALESEYEYVIFLETRLSRLQSLVDYTKRAGKKALIHVDLIQGLKADEYGMEFLVREIKPHGVLSTRGNIIKLARKHKLLAIQRVFLLDSHALEQNIKMINRFQPDCIEVLPGIIPDAIQELSGQTDKPVIAGGLIRSSEEVKNALTQGAVAVTTSNNKLWN
ncbi:glycerol-3-phosphate responsive antiterminator [Virgibacillus ihumii]|uniref:glycerol-3-phosphate responsive antiterminator n=1 Tax=Virgibacillus ihumii TaxID=2686091 RepID=UPI00157CBED1|nr:glycerol-3-phosphate responsive antiterminator [Virgibacillus ihumii]